MVELRFSVGAKKPPWTVQFIAMLDESSELTVEEEAEIGEWLEQVLLAEAGPVENIALAFRTESTISLRDYIATTRLQLDHIDDDEVISW